MHAVRTERQRSQASSAELARRFGINEKTVRKWRSLAVVEDEPMGPKARRSSVLPLIEEAAVVALRVQAACHLMTSPRAEGRLPSSDVFVAAPLPSASRHLPSAAGGSREAQAVQGLRDWLLPYRHRGAALRGRQGLSVSARGPHLQAGHLELPAFAAGEDRKECRHRVERSVD